jgi:pimeloyl-ACP methyl ester carboxylesterase/DNA-binding SARP family transcriptional activator
MEFRILGPLEAGDPPLALGGGKQRALLAVLLVNAGRTVPRSRLIDDLWGEDVPETAAKMVQIHVSQLRKALPAGLLATRPPGYALEVAPEDVDLHRAERLLADARAARETGYAGAAAEALREALGLWRGEALAEFDEPFAAVEAARIEELRLALTEERIDIDIALGRHADVVGELEALIARHPLRERPRGQLMLALYRSGRQAEALAAFQETRRALDEELGLEPSPALRELERRILRQDPDLDAPPPPASSPSPPRPVPAATGAMVGREAELARLEALVEEAAAGEARLVVVSGEAGLGKTTLVDAFLPGACARAGAAVARGQCVEQHGAAEAYMPLLEALADLCGGGGGAQATRVLGERAPMWLLQLPGLVSDAERPALERRAVGATPARMLREGVDGLLALAAARPVVLVLEDLHWSDAPTIDLLGALARRRGPARLLVLATLRLDDAATRDHPAHALVGELRPRGLLEEIALAPLGADEVDRYVAQRLPGASLPPAAGALLLDRSRGNPLYLEKAVDAWVETGRVQREGAAWRVDADADDLAAGIPDSLRELIRDRLRQVPEDARGLVDAAGVVGGEFSAALVAAAAERPVEEAEDGLERLARAGLLLAPRGVEAWPDGTVASRYGFTHDLCQEVAYDDLAAGRRARLHLRVAGRLEEAYGDRADEVAAELATHYTRGGDGARAVPHLLATARRAASRRAGREAAESARAGLRLLEALPPGRARDETELELHRVLAPALIQVEGWSSPAAEESFARAHALAAAVGGPEEVGWALYRLATLHEVRGDYARSEAILDEALGLLDAGTSAGLRVESHELMACTLFHQGAFPGALENAERALSAHDGVYEDPINASYGETPAVACQIWAVHSLWFLGREDEALARARRVLELAERLGTVHARCLAHVQVAMLHCMRGEPAPARAHAETAIDAAREAGFAYRLAMGMVARAWALAAEGDADEGIAELRRAIGLSRATGARMDEAFYLALLADACARAGRTVEALAALDEARAVVPRDGRFYWEAEIARLGGELLVRAGRVEEGEAELRRALEVARGQGSPALQRRAQSALARVLRAAGREAEAAAVGGPPARPAVRYARSGELSIAYEVTGEGPPDLVLVPGFVSHLTMDRAEPRHLRFLDRLASFSRLIRFDKRGTGLSDRPPGLPDLETRMDDVRAVMDAAGSRRAVVLGYSEGGSLAVLFAATHPERVSGLVLVGSYAKRVGPDDDYPWAVSPEERRRHIDALEEDWGFEAMLAGMGPSTDEAMARWWGERCRAAASPGAVRALMEMNSLIDVRDVLPAIRTPSLVLHRAGDVRVPVGHGRYLGERIPGARYVELPGADHFIAVDPDQILDVVEPWVRGLGAEAPRAEEDDPVLATILVADPPGDEAALRADVARHRGTVAGAPGVALFDGPTRAVRCGLEVAGRIGAAGGRVGIHTGEVAGARGPAVDVAAALARAGVPGEVVVSATTRDLVPGSGLAFADLSPSRETATPASSAHVELPIPAASTGEAATTKATTEPVAPSPVSER